jgi:OFA family oxalate/formate antiporter-like MFS transporter
LKEATGSWHAVFVTAAILNAIAALMAILVLKPLRKAQIEKSNREAQTQAPGQAAAVAT